MRENDIRPDRTDAEVNRLASIDFKKVLDRRGEFVDVNCPACDANEHDLFFKRAGYSFLKCSNCDTVYVSPRPTNEILSYYYLNSLSDKFWSESIYPETDKARLEYIVKPRVERVISLCNKYHVSQNTLMDVGSGFGTFCLEMKNSGKFKNIIAVEPIPSLAQSCRDKGLEVSEEFVVNLQSQSVDVITAFELLEHLFDPAEYLYGLSNKIERGGLLFATTPNIKGFDIFILKDKSDHTMAPAHLNYFHPKSLSLLLERLGFEVLEVQTPGKLDAELVRKKVLNNVITLDDQPFLKRILIDEHEHYMDSFQQWIADNGLSSHMWVVARKR